MPNDSRDTSRYSNEPVLAIVIPCYNEEEVLAISINRLLDSLSGLVSSCMCSQKSYLVFVDDGSCDATWDLIASSAKRYPDRIRGVRLSRNFGHQAALLAGLEYVRGKCDIVVTIDADLQDDIDVIGDMITSYKKGNEIVLGVRSTRESDGSFKRWTAMVYYRLMHLLGVDMVMDHADFRMMSAKTLDYLDRFQEYHLFLRAMVMMLHNRIGTVTYSRSARIAGEPKYDLRKMLSLGWDGITSFSVVPLRIITFVGAAIFIGAMGLAVYSFTEKIMGNVVPGWTSIAVPMYFLGGMVMLSLGIVGEYIGKIFIEVKRRPRFLIDEVIEDVSMLGKQEHEKKIN